MEHTESTPSFLAPPYPEHNVFLCVPAPESSALLEVLIAVNRKQAQASFQGFWGEECVACSSLSELLYMEQAIERLEQAEAAPDATEGLKTFSVLFEALATAQPPDAMAQPIDLSETHVALGVVLVRAPNEAHAMAQTFAQHPDWLVLSAQDMSGLAEVIEDLRKAQRGETIATVVGEGNA